MGQAAVVADGGVRQVQGARVASIGGVVIVEGLVLFTLVKLATSGLTFGTALLSYAMTNAWLAGAFAPFGALVAYRRPRLPLGWLFLAFGVFYSVSSVGIAFITVNFASSGAPGMAPAVVTVFQSIWTPAVAVCFPLILLLFPSGRLVSRRWSWLVVLALTDGVVWMVGWAVTVQGGFASFSPDVSHALHRMTTISNYGLLVVFFGSVVPLSVRRRSSTGRERSQLTWLLAGSTTAVALFLPTAWGVSSYWATGMLIGVPLFPIACAVALLRHRLFDLDIVLNRGLVYLTTSAVVFGVYLGVVEGARATVGRDADLGASIVAAALVAVMFVPARATAQRVVSRLLFGARGDPGRALTTLVSSMEASGPDELAATLASVGQSLRLPHLMLSVEGREVGLPGADGLPVGLPLRFGERQVGELRAWPRRGQAGLDTRDLEVLRLVAGPLASVVHAVQLTEALQRSRLAIVRTRQGERERLHRDMHDGLGPMLTGMALKADAAGNITPSDPDRGVALVQGIAEEARAAITEVRRIAHDLRPPTLEDLGLLDALVVEAARFPQRLDGQPLVVTTDLPAAVPAMPADVATAAFRIVAESLTNVARHSDATRVRIAVRCGDHLTIEVSDDGSNLSAWADGFGVTSMRRRAETCGGSLTAGPTPAGGQVRALLPLSTVGTDS